MLNLLSTPNTYLFLNPKKPLVVVVVLMLINDCGVIGRLSAFSFFFLAITTGGAVLTFKKFFFTFKFYQK
jgi:hypothetical protein